MQDCNIKVTLNKISVCIATYNGEKYIKQQLDSILPQLGAEDEIIISDNGSVDNTINIIKSINDDRIIIIKDPDIKSATLNFENALKKATGDYIFLSDQDDVWKENKVATCMKWLKHYDCVISDAEMTDANLKVINCSYFKAHKSKRGRLYNTLIKNGYMGCCMAFTHRVLEASLPFPKDIPLHDIWIGNVAAYMYSVKFINDKLLLFRCHDKNNSFTAAIKSGYPIYKQFLFRWNTVKNLIIKIAKR